MSNVTAEQDGEGAGIWALQKSSSSRIIYLPLICVQGRPNSAVVMLHKLQGLQEVEISRGKQLRCLSIAGCEQLEKVVLNGVTSLEQLTIAECGSLREVQGLQGLSTLRVLELSGCSLTKVCPQPLTTPTWCYHRCDVAALIDCAPTCGSLWLPRRAD
jgi:hypothetical protein